MYTPKLSRSVLAMGAVCASLVACGPGEKEGEGVAVDHTTTRQAINGNINGVASKLTRTMAFLENSDIFNTGFDAAFQARGSETTCEGGIDPNTGEPVEEFCEPPAPAPEVDLSVEAEAEQGTEWLDTYIFADANVETEAGNSVTYLLKGSVVCAPEGEPADPQCVSDVDAAEIRLVVTSPSDGNIDLDVLVGPNKDNPVSFELHEDLLAAEADLAGIKASANHIGTITGEPVELPATMEGRVRAQLSGDGADVVAAAFSVLSPIKVADGDYSFSLGASDPALSLTVDGAAKTVNSIVDFGAMDGSMPQVEYAYDETTGEETETSYQMGFHIGGISATTLLDAATELVKVTNIGLGSTTTTMSVDGAEVLAIDLNPADGRTLDVTASKGANDTVEFEVSPKLDLAVAFKFAAAAGKMGEMADWMLDDVFRLKLDGAAKPKVRAGDNGIEVLEGTLSMSLDNAGATLSVDAGSCLLSVEGDIVVDGSEPVDPGTDPEPVEPGPDSSNPVDEYEAGACQ